MSNVTTNDGRILFRDDGVYLIRDVFYDGKFVHCEYATMIGDGTIGDGLLQWWPFQDGVEYSSIKPVVSIARASDLMIYPKNDYATDFKMLKELSIKEAEH